MKKLMLLPLLLVVVSCQSGKSNKLKVGINAEYPPYEYVVGDELVGFNIDVVTDVLSNAGIEFEFVNMGFEGLLSALQSQKVDLVVGVSPTPDRAKIVDYTERYSFPNDEGHSLIVHKEETANISIDNLQGKSVGVLLGSMQESILKDIGGIEVKLYNNYTGALLDLNTKKLDGVVASQKPAEEYLNQNPELVFMGLVKDTTGGGGYAVALNKGKDELKEKLNVEIQKLLDNGVVQKYRDKYKLDELEKKE